MSGSKFQAHFVLLCEQLNLDPLLPYLRQERMVTSDEYETLTNPAFTRKQRRERLLIILPRKGRRYFENFGKCLVWSGQKELARNIGVDVDSVPDPPYVPPMAPVDRVQEDRHLLQTLKNLIAGVNSSPNPPPPPYSHNSDLSAPSQQHPPSYPHVATPPTSSPGHLGYPVDQEASLVKEKQQPPSQDEYRRGVVSQAEGGGVFRAMAPARNVSSTSSADSLTGVSCQTSRVSPRSSLSEGVGGGRGPALDPVSYSSYPSYQSPIGGGGMGGGAQYQPSGSGGGAQYPSGGGGGGGSGGGAQNLSSGGGGAEGGAFYNQQPAHQLPANGGVEPGPIHIYENIEHIGARRNVKKVFILYCKDHLLKALFNISEQDFCNDVLELADSLTACGGIECAVDFYVDIHPTSWSLWTERNIRECDHVIYVCSPLLISDLRSEDQRHIYMSYGTFFNNVMVHSIVAPKFVPVFLNECVPRDLKDWLPSQLHGTKSYVLKSLRNFHKSVFVHPPELRNEEVAKCMGMPKYSELATLVRYLRGEREVLPPPRPGHPIPVPVQPAARPSPRYNMYGQYGNVNNLSEFISEADLIKIAHTIPRDWMQLGIKLGVEYSTLEALRRRFDTDYVLAVLEVIHIWQVLQGREATRRALKKALIDIGFARIAVECFPDERI